MKTLYFDCFSGISGDMTVGAMLDLGLDPGYLRDELRKLPIDGYEIRSSRTVRANLSAMKFDVIMGGGGPVVSERSVDAGSSHSHGGIVHSHHHSGPHDHDQPGSHAGLHRRASEILDMIRSSGLSLRARTSGLAIFEKLAIAEGEVHGVPPADVEFHEVGMVDSIVDVCATAIGLDALEIENCICSPVNIGGGFIHCQHGIYPVPAPASANLLRKATIYSSHVQKELVTPTGAAILAGVVSRFDGLTGFVPERIGYGAGSKQFGNFPNCLRLMIGEETDPALSGNRVPLPGGDDAVTVIEANLDDMAPQNLSFAMDRLLEAGALDVCTIPAMMKKGRPGHLLQVIAPPNRLQELIGIVFRETSTIGLRMHPVRREVLERELVPVLTEWGTIQVKVSKSPAGALTVMPEFEDCARVARQFDVPLKAVQERAVREYMRISES